MHFAALEKVSRVIAAAFLQHTEMTVSQTGAAHAMVFSGSSLGFITLGPGLPSSVVEALFVCLLHISFTMVCSEGGGVYLQARFVWGGRWAGGLRGTLPLKIRWAHGGRSVTSVATRWGQPSPAGTSTLASTITLLSYFPKTFSSRRQVWSCSS